MKTIMKDMFVIPRWFRASQTEGCSGHPSICQAGLTSQDDGRLFRALVAVLALGALAGCSKLKLEEPSHSNPVDPDNPEFVEPGVQLNGTPAENGTVATNSVLFHWSAIGAATAYCYNIDSTGWTAWKADTSATVSGLTEGWHYFEVKAVDGGGYQGSVHAHRHFRVNQYANTVMIYPRTATVKVGDTLQLWCELEDMATPVSAVEMVIYLQYYYLDTLGASADTGNYWRSNNGSPVGPLFTNYGANYLQAALGVAGGQPAGVRNSGRIFKIKAVAMHTGTIYPQMIALTVRDTLNQPVTTTLPPSCTIKITAK